MTGLQLVHLTYAGSGRPLAQILFGPELTVIYGASDTGKSFIVESIEYMLGGADLTMVPEAHGYSQIILGLLLPDGSPLTLVRRPETNSIHLHSADLRDLVTQTPQATVTAVHNARSKNSLSLRLMRALGLEQVLIRKNEAGGTRQLTLTDLVHLSLVTESRMIASRSPVLRTGAPTTRTAETSVMRFLLTGESDPSLETGPNAGQRRVHRGKIQLLDRLVLDLSAKLATEQDVRTLRGRHDRIRMSIEENSRSLQEADDDHRRAVQDRMISARELAVVNERLDEVSDLLGRFRLLEAQYRSDLDRLAMVNEAGSILGYFRVGTCVFCGAEPEHQHPGHNQEETTQLHAAVHAEAAKTTALLSDLLPTISDLTDEQVMLSQRRRNVQEVLQLRDSVIADAEARLVPTRAALDELLDERSKVERELELHERIEELEDRRSQLDGESATSTTRPAQYIPGRILAAFETILQQTLDTWRVPAVDRAEYDQYNVEVRAGGRSRAGRGKGVRSVLHSAFTTALARYCIDQDLHHLGFVVLDSPVVTYRDPVKASADPDPDVPDVLINSTVVERFYKDMLTFPGQAIIVENGDPPVQVLSEATTYTFTADTDGRPGFFPQFLR
ncbi:hypothetical protein [Kitasatospora purpeofusca]|uniref:hypothetical protein n=1 Tax=Kitasatospora purpeofusca TaxID=67352 RepID=UPI0022589096|nr:hypothetical protein [Kitasatospora purpeofusca]MCX4753472.1 hypothetical protein [Kitasatospora purpeofusca]WSR32968.1 hypothetical protein OG715_19445 [Kitasatospora purpeofusca]